MVRMARAVIVGNPYHITHRGNQRRDVFFRGLNRQLYPRTARSRCMIAVQGSTRSMQSTHPRHASAP